MAKIILYKLLVILEKIIQIKSIYRRQRSRVLKAFSKEYKFKNIYRIS